MFNSVYITKISKYLPNNPVLNDEMEESLGLIKGLKSRSKALVLRSNGIKCRYYALDKNGVSTHTNADLTAEAIKKLENNKFSIKDIQLLTCGSASPDLLMPSLASMVHGKLDMSSVDVMSASGSCNSSMWGFNYAWMSLLIGKYSNAVCTGSEKQSISMVAHNFEEESKHHEKLNNNPYIAFEKEFLRWMLSDGAAAVLLENKSNTDSISLLIDWVEIRSYANRIETCMYAGGIKDKSGEIIPWRDIEHKKWLEESIFSLKQDSKLLEKSITNFGSEFLSELGQKYHLNYSQLSYFLPHISSEFFRSKIKDSLLEKNILIDDAMVYKFR
jgi:3-oxoacyl-[acyl-carrier-protein] synthase III